MADDSMEISSEHGQNTGDDIDIDIDITAGQADEDYILQDTLSTVDYGNEFPTQPSPAVHHDDLMVDDDNASYQMDDADFIQDEAEHIAEPESMSFAQTDILYTHGDDGSAADAIIYSEDHDIGLFFGQDGGNEMDATGRDLVLDSENISHDGNIAPIPEGVLPHADTILPQDYSNQGDQADKSPSQSLGPSPQSRSPAAAAEEPRSPPASLGHLSPVRESNDTISDPTSNPQEASGEVDEPESIEHTYDFLTARGVKVVYQSVEYALFATSDSDDPDSYFLSDLAIIEKPLEQFFSAIREIIRDDLTADEELCLNVEDLGLETEEASSNLKDVTLSQILNLHDELLRNDSVDSPGPLYLLLGTRVNFIKRLASLAEGASLGKGFSEMAGLENRSQSVDDVGDGDETARNVQSNYENLERANDATGDTTQGIEKGDLENGPSTEDQVDSLEIYEEAEVPDDEKEASERHDEQQAAPEEYPEDYDEQNTAQKESREEGKDQNTARTDYQEYEQITTQQGEHTEHHREDVKSKPVAHSPAMTDNAKDSIVTNSSHKTKSDSVPDSSSKHTDTIKPLLESTSEITKDPDNEEEDLIDYSDEEIQYPDEVGGHRTVIVTDGDRTDNEYQAKDEELNRRSLSRQAEEKLLEKTADQTYTDGNGDYPEEYLEANDTGYDEYSTEFQHGEASDSYEFVEHSGEYNGTGHEDQDDLSNELGAFVDDEADYKHDPELGTESYNDNDDTNYEDLNDEESGSQGLATYAEPTIPQQSSEFVDVNDNANVLEGPAPSTVSSLGAAETAGSSVTLGAEEIQYEDGLDEEISNELDNEFAAKPTNSSVVEQKDEIDYEDDEDEESPSSASPGAVQAAKELTNTNGKRFIAEVESELSTPSKDAKRPRSS